MLIQLKNNLKFKFLFKIFKNIDILNIPFFQKSFFNMKDSDLVSSKQTA